MGAKKCEYFARSIAACRRVAAVCGAGVRRGNKAPGIFPQHFSAAFGHPPLYVGLRWGVDGGAKSLIYMGFFARIDIPAHWCKM